MDENLKSIIYQTRARILWGESREEIILDLQNQGLPDAVIAKIFAYCLKERGDEVRKSGMRDIVIGIALIIIGVLLVLLRFGYEVALTKGMIFCSLTTLLGIWRLIDGVHKMILGARAIGSVTEM